MGFKFILEFWKMKIILKKISKNVKKISNTLLIASIPSMVGFLSFVPTNYVGLSELG